MSCQLSLFAKSYLNMDPKDMVAVSLPLVLLQCLNGVMSQTSEYWLLHSWIGQDQLSPVCQQFHCSVYSQMQQSQQSLLSPLQATLSWLTLWGHTLVPRITSTEWERTHMKTLLWKWIHSSQSFPDKNATDMPTLIWFLCMTTMSGLPQSVTDSVCSAAQTACVVGWM